MNSSECRSNFLCKMLVERCTQIFYFQACSNAGSYLPEPSNESENAALIDILPVNEEYYDSEGDGIFWLGFRIKYTSFFESARSGTQVTFFNWDDDHSDSDQGECIAFRSKNLKWTLRDCYSFAWTNCQIGKKNLNLSLKINQGFHWLEVRHLKQVFVKYK